MRLRDGLRGLVGWIKKLDLQQVALLLVGTALALLVRLSLLGFKSADFDTRSFPSSDARSSGALR